MPEPRFSTCLIIGIGVPARSVVSLERLLPLLPATSHCAFVVITALNANQQGQLVKRLQAYTTLPIVEVQEATQVQPNHLYLAPAQRLLTLTQGVLQPQKPTTSASRRAPIDFFFQALAADAAADAVGVLLAGQGTDGVAGLQAIKAQGGQTLMQTPETPQQEPLLHQALATSLIDQVGPLERLVTHFVEPNSAHEPDPAVMAEQKLDEPGVDNDALLLDILNELSIHTGHDFSYYKRSTLLRRISRRVQTHNLTSLADYLAYLRTHPAEGETLIQEFLISVTSFFRDPAAFAALEQQVISQIFAAKAPNEPVRVWVVGCATGEEAYAIAMLLAEQGAMGRAWAGATSHAPRVQVFATDIDEEALAFARRGFYAKSIAANLTPARLQRFFNEEKVGYQVKADLRELVLFATHNLLKDPPFSKLDLICCRNVLIYFNREAQEKSFELFHYALNREPPDSSYLFLGTSESADAVPQLFSSVDQSHHLYRRRSNNADAALRLPTPAFVNQGGKLNTTNLRPTEDKLQNLQTTYATWTLKQYAPPRLLVDKNYQIVQLFNQAGRYLQEPDGPSTQNLLHKILPALRLDLRTALYQAFHKEERTKSRLIQVLVNNEPCFIQLNVGPVTEAHFPKEYVEVVFEERQEAILVGASNQEAPENELVTQLEEELQRTRDRMQGIMEEHDSSTQELKAANEELQSVNEELKSTTEELETSKEELQSMNEELVTVNQELKFKLEELRRANSDLLNLIASTQVGVIFLDPLLRVKRFTPRTTELFFLIDSDIGRPFAHIAHRIRSGAMGTSPLAMATQVRNTLGQREEIVQGDNERWYMLRIFPYRTLDNTVDGVVLTLIDMTDWQRAEHELQQRLQQQAVAMLGRQALQGDDLASLLATAAQQISTILDVEFSSIFALQPDGALRLQTGNGWGADVLGEATVSADRDFPIWAALRMNEPVMVETSISAVGAPPAPLLNEHGIVSGVSLVIPGRDQPYGVLGAYSTQPRPFTPYDIDFLQAVANLLAEAIRQKTIEAQLAFQAHLLDTVEQAVIATDLSGRIIYWNRFAENLYGWPAVEALGRNILEVTPAAMTRAQASALMAQLQRGASWSGEFMVQRRDGSPFLALVTDSPIFDEKGALQGIVGISLDITERKTAEERLRASEERLRLGISIAGLALAEVDYTTDQIRLSPEAAALFGLPPTPETTSRAAIHSLFHPDDRTEIFWRMGEALDPAGTGEFAMEHRIVRPDGQVRWLNVRKQIFFDPAQDGPARPVRALLAALDVTERKAAEEAIRRNEERLRLALDGAQMGTWVWDITTDALEWDAQQFKLFGIDPAAFSGRGNEPMARLHPADRALVEDAVTQAIAQNRLFRYEFRVIHPDQAVHWLAGLAQPLANEQGSPAQLIGLNFDITERKLAEEAMAAHATTLAQLNADLLRSNQELDDFAHVVAHDLKEPVRGISNYAAFLCEDYESQFSGEGLEMLQALPRLSQRMEMLLDTLLSYARLGRQTLTQQPVNMQNLLDETLDLLGPRIAEAGVAIRVPQLLPSAQGDPVLLAEVFTNLLTNAIKYNDKAEKWVEVGSINQEAGPVFYVRDNGIGIPQAQQTEVFRIFRRLHGRDEFGGGMGTGLTIVKRVIERHGGHIWLESILGAGTTFYFTLST